MPPDPPSVPAASSPARQQDEAARLAALHRYQVLDTPEEESFDRLVELAHELLDAPVALVSLLDQDREWFKARFGLAVRQMPRDGALCEHAMRCTPPEVFVVPNARADPRFANHPLVTGEPRIRFYAAAALVTPDGQGIGTFGIISTEPRPQGLSAEQHRWLLALARLAMDELELRLQARRAQEAVAAAEAARDAERRLRRAQEAAGVVAFEFGPGGMAEASEALRALHGVPPGVPIDFTSLLPVLHPEDRMEFAAIRERLASQGGPFTHEYRVVHPDGSIHWLQARGEALPREQPGGPPRRLAGVVSDITERRRAQERQTLLAREVDHRAKNALAVVQAAMRLTRAENQGDYIRAVEGRVAALARAQSLLAQQGWGGADLRSLAEGELAPFLSGLGARGGGPKIRCCGHPLVIAPQAVQPLSMILHELATNAVKHGALSTPQGRLAIVWRQEPGSGDLRLRWAERGGPAIAAPPTRQGFGSRLVEQTTASQLGGTVERRWHAAGLVCELLLPADRVLAGG